MPATNTSTPRITRKFYDIEFSVPAPFTAGHALTTNEANFLNINVAGVVGNAYSGDIRRAMVAHNAEALKAHTEGGGKAKDFKPTTDISVLGWDHAAKFAEKYEDYELGVSNRGSGDGTSSATPLDRMISFLATEDLKARMAKKGLKVAAFYKAAANDTGKFKSRWAELLAQNIERNRDAFTSAAQSQLDAMGSDEAEGDDLLDGVDAPSETVEEVAAAAE